MPAIQNRAQQAPSEEMPEQAMTGPFGGVQSELPLDAIEDLGFADCTNVLFRKGVGYLRPGYTLLTQFPTDPGDPVLGIADFFNVDEVRIQCVITQHHLWMFNSNTETWTEITGPGFTGSATQTWGWDVVDNTLCFSQGADLLWLWDGVSPTYTQASASAPAANFVAEIGFHLMTQNIILASQSLPQGYAWSGIGDPTDWTSFSSGNNNLVNNLGPGRGILKLGQYGYGWHNWGIVQIQPTGIGAEPFYFTNIANSNVGNICPRSLARFNKDGVECAAYVGKDNVYIFNQASVIPIGDRPLDGARRFGARSRIFADLLTADALTAYGFVTQNIGGQIYNAYWLIIPGVSIWLYNLDEGNWSNWRYNPLPDPTVG